MKRLSLLLGIALLFGMTQCKKNVDPVVPGSGNAGTVNLTLNVGGGSGNGSKVGVDTETGAVTFESGDVIFVADETQGYLGYMSYGGGSTFSGSITTPTEGEYLYFYFIGNHGYGDVTITDNKITASISDQSEMLPVVSCNTSTQVYTPSVTSYSSKLRNKCALVKFNVTTGSTKNIYFTGVNNTVTFTMGSTEASYSQSGEGKIILNGTGSGTDTEKWAILFPMEEGLSAGADGTAYSVDGCYKGSRPAIPAIIANGFNSTGIDMSVSTMLNPEGTIPGLFTVNSSGKQVYFAKGNLKITAADTWGFDDNQWDTHTDVPTLGSGYPRYYFTWAEVVNSSDNPKTFTIGGEDFTLFTKAEWEYVLGLDGNARGGSSVSASGHFYVKATVNDKYGLIILPDNWSDSYFSFTGYNTTGSVSNTVTAGQWATLEESGCVFMPVAGVSYSDTVDNASSGQYWSATQGSSAHAFYFYFGSPELYVTYDNKVNGRRVRMVRVK